ncbi:hypothetical protein Fmac_008357 [Flemingia macrophylla]|uniref:Uncharacterized protein n=1 Tax=Flemingia macrophylla TaxID=520843 RepID=A0ABD1MX61_9FABA
MASNSQQLRARNDVIVIRRVHDVATDTSANTRKLEGKLDALVKLVTQLAMNQKSASVARVFGISTSLVERVFGIRSSNDHRTNVYPSLKQSRVNEHPEAYATTIYSTAAEARHLTEKMASNSQQFNARNDAIVIRGVHDVVIDTFAETIKLEGKLDALVNLLTQLAGNQQSASVLRVFGIRSSNDHHSNVYPSLQQSGVNEHPEAYAANINSTTTEVRHLIENMASNSQ